MVDLSKSQSSFQFGTKLTRQLDGRTGIDDVVFDHSSFILVLPRMSLSFYLYFWLFRSIPQALIAKSEMELTHRDQIQLLYLAVVTSPNCFALLLMRLDIRGWSLVYTRIVDHMYHLMRYQCYMAPN